MTLGVATRTRKAALRAGAALAVAAAVYFFWPRPYPDYPAAVCAGLRLIECEARVDTDCMYEFILDEERKAFSLTKEKWRWLLKEFGKGTRWPQPVPGGKVTYYGNEAFGHLVVTREGIDGDGKPCHVGAVIVRTDEGYRRPGMVNSLLVGLTIHRDRRGESGGDPGPAERAEAYLRHAAELRANGFPGSFFGGEKFMTWEERAALARQASQSAAAGGG